MARPFNTEKLGKRINDHCNYRSKKSAKNNNGFYFFTFFNFAYTFHKDIP